MDVDAELSSLNVGEAHRNRLGQDDRGRGLGQSTAPGRRFITRGVPYTSALTPGNQTHPRARVSPGNDLGNPDASGSEEGLHPLGGAAGARLGLVTRRLPQSRLEGRGGAQLEGSQAQVGQSGGGWAPGASGEPPLELPAHAVGELGEGGNGLQHPASGQVGAVLAAGGNAEASDGEPCGQEAGRQVLGEVAGGEGGGRR